MAYHSFCMNLQYTRIKVISDLDENEHKSCFSFCNNLKSVQSFLMQVYKKNNKCKIGIFLNRLLLHIISLAKDL